MLMKLSYRDINQVKIKKFKAKIPSLMHFFTFSGFSVSPDTILGHSFMYMTQYMNSKPNNLQLSSEERRKRNRTFIDPVTEVPRLEQW